MNTDAGRSVLSEYLLTVHDSWISNLTVAQLHQALQAVQNTLLLWSSTDAEASYRKLTQIEGALEYKSKCEYINSKYLDPKLYHQHRDTMREI